MERLHLPRTSASSNRTAVPTASASRLAGAGKVKASEPAEGEEWCGREGAGCGTVAGSGSSSTASEGKSDGPFVAVAISVAPTTPTPPTAACNHLVTLSHPCTRSAPAGRPSPGLHVFAPVP